jgi:hypothetical protein
MENSMRRDQIIRMPVTGTLLTQEELLPRAGKYKVEQDATFFLTPVDS